MTQVVAVWVVVVALVVVLVVGAVLPEDETEE
jgi:hypothetical protein